MRGMDGQHITVEMVIRLPAFLLELLTSITIYGRLSTVLMIMGLVCSFSDNHRENIHAG